MDFYDLIDIYGEVNNKEQAETLPLWHKRKITAVDILKAYLEYEGIYGYGEQLVQVIRLLSMRSIDDGHGDPWNIRD